MEGCGECRKPLQLTGTEKGVLAVHMFVHALLGLCVAVHKPELAAIEDCELFASRNSPCGTEQDHQAINIDTVIQVWLCAVVEQRPRSQSKEVVSRRSAKEVVL